MRPGVRNLRASRLAVWGYLWGISMCLLLLSYPLDGVMSTFILMHEMHIYICTFIYFCLIYNFFS